VEARAPSFNHLQPASRASPRSKQANRAADTHHEHVLCQPLWRLGLRYRKNVRSLPGKPDVVFFAYKVAVFCDGDFWHGRKWSSLRQKLADGANAVYWTAKIDANRQRDERVSAGLRKAGWRVVRFWEGDVLKNPARVAAKVYRIVKARLQQYGGEVHER